MELVNSLVTDRVLIFGSLPPRGRDLDLLALPTEEAAIAEGLAQAGFTNKGILWAKFARRSAAVVELVPARNWRLPKSELAELFARAAPVPQAANLARPAPHHRLLILARKVALARGPLSPKHRTAVREALVEDPEAWEKAWAAADAWRAKRSLRRLEAVYHDPDAAAPGGAAVAARRLLRRTRARIAKPRRRGLLVSLSGLDGCGKSTQAANLERALTQLGEEAVVEWTSIVNQPQAVSQLKQAVNAVLQRARRRSPGSAKHGAGSAEFDPANELRHRSALVSFGWSALQAVTNAFRQRRATLRHLRQGKIVICDRYVLDAEVHLRYAYPQAHNFWGARLQNLVMRRVPPPAKLLFFLDVPPEVATRRKADYELEDNAVRGELYRELHAEHGATRLDGTRPEEEISAQIAREVWRAV